MLRSSRVVLAVPLQHVQDISSTVANLVNHAKRHTPHKITTSSNPEAASPTHRILPSRFHIPSPM